MKLGKPLYFIAIIGMIIISVLMFKHNWLFLGYFTALIVFAGFVNYLDIIHNNRVSRSATARKQRRERFQNLSAKEKEEYLDNIERELIENNKN